MKVSTKPQTSVSQEWLAFCRRYFVTSRQWKSQGAVKTSLDCFRRYAHLTFCLRTEDGAMKDASFISRNASVSVSVSVPSCVFSSPEHGERWPENWSSPLPTCQPAEVARILTTTTTIPASACFRCPPLAMTYISSFLLQGFLSFFSPNKDTSSFF